MSVECGIILIKEYMTDFIKELQALQKPTKEKVHTVTIGGQTIVVTLEKKLEVMKYGEDAYMWKTATEFVLKPPKTKKTRYSILKTTPQGYQFEEGDIHWPNGVVKGGKAWQLPE